MLWIYIYMLCTKKLSISFENLENSNLFTPPCWILSIYSICRVVCFVHRSLSRVGVGMLWNRCSFLTLTHAEVGAVMFEGFRGANLAAHRAFLPWCSTRFMGALDWCLMVPNLRKPIIEYVCFTTRLILVHCYLS